MACPASSSGKDVTGGIWPLLERYPALGDVPRIELRVEPTPIKSLEQLGRQLWIKRDDLTALPIGGNKVRSLEFLLGGVRPGNHVSTVGPHGSTHALATAVYARSLGAHVSVGLWRQEMNTVAEVVASELQRVSSETRELRSPAIALPWLWWRRTRGDCTIPPGGTSTLGMLGHVNAGLELAEQIARGEMPEPSAIVVPYGTGGTAAGIALGLRIAGIRPIIIAARVVPWVLGRRGRIERLANATARFIHRRTGQKVPSVTSPAFRVANSVYGGGYGRALQRAAAASKQLNTAIGVQLDSTYAGKAFVAALEESSESTTLFWLTFDSRWLSSRPIRMPQTNSVGGTVPQPA